MVKSSSFKPIDLSKVSLNLERLDKEKVKKTIDLTNEEGKVTLKIYKSEVVSVSEGRHKFAVTVDLVNSGGNGKSLWCYDGSVMARMYCSIGDDCQSLKSACAYAMRDTPGKEIRRGNTGSNNNKFYPFKLVVFTVAVDGSIHDVNESFEELVDIIAGIHSAPNFQENFLLVKGSMETVSSKFLTVLEANFKKKKDFALLLEDSFSYEIYENHKLIDLFFEDSIKHGIQQNLFYEDLKSQDDESIIEQINSFGL